MSDHPRQEPVSSRRVMRGRVFSVRRDVVRLPDGRHVRREVVEHPGAVVVAPLLDDGRILFVRQYRYAAGRHLVELPAGTLEPGEDPAATAARELQEECGCRAGRLEPLGTFYSAPGFCTELLHAYAALDLVPAAAEPDPDEDIEVVVMSLQEALQQAAGGGLQDAKSLAVLLLLLQRGVVAPAGLGML
ncbi:MAG: NUDIX hydrolase [Thermaerobacter sp.]|nr:MAG: ADP-ribose pyrophosphatase [Bacillota bacterium]